MKQSLIVGGSTGMGKATAKILLEQGIEVAIVARKGEKLTAGAEELSSIGQLKCYGVDLANMNEVRAFCEILPTELPQLTYLVNAAGYFNPKPFFSTYRRRLCYLS